MILGPSSLGALISICSGFPASSSSVVASAATTGVGAVGSATATGAGGGAAHDAALAHPHDTALAYPHRMTSFDTALAQSEALNADANTLFGEKRYDEALAKYTTAAELVELHAQRLKEAEMPYCKYLCNRAAAYLGAHKPIFPQGGNCFFQSMVSYVLN